MPTRLIWGRVLLSVAVLVMVFAIAEPAWPQSSALTVTLTGQSMLRSDIRSSAPAAVPTISALLKGADVVFTNLEAVVTEPGQPNENTPGAASRAAFFTPPEVMDALKALGFNIISTVNNHASNLGTVGFLNTLKHADRVGLPRSGTGKTLAEASAPAILKTPHGTVALVSSASGFLGPEDAATATKPGSNELRVGQGNVPNEEDAARILQSIRDATKMADLVIVYQHNHVFDLPFSRMFLSSMPERRRPAPWLIEWVHREIDAGADLVVMHGAPLLHGIEIYKGKPIFYDLGNFFFNAPMPMWSLEEPITFQSIVPTVTFQGKSLQSITFRPILLNYLGQGQPEAHDWSVNNQFLQTRGLPAPAEGDTATDILQQMVEMSAPFGTRIMVKGDRAEVVIPTGSRR